MQADLTAVIGANTQLLEEALRKAVAKPYKLNFSVDQGASGALGRIRSQLGEFDKSLAASNARVMAFSLSASSMFAVTKSLKEMVRVTVEVERKMTSINSILGAGRSQFKQFGNDLFKIARDTSTSFEEVADAAEELARQGVGIEETLKRTSSAMKLAKVSGVEVKTAVDAITAALNSNNDAWLDSEKLINKLVAVDAKFAVSAGGLAEAIKRVGSVASDAGLDIDDLIAAITSAQQTTARGEAVIGNALKTIFTRAQRPKVIEDFEALGIATKKASGENESLATVLTNVAKRYDDLSSAQQQSVSELVGGVYQINILKALFRDLGKETSFFGSALKTSKNATNEADRRVAELNETLDSLFKKLTVNLTQVGSGVGNDVFGPLFKNLLKSANAGLEQVSRDMSGESGQFLGKALEAIFKGIGNTLNSPILIGGFITISRFLLQTAKEGREAIKTLAGLNNSLHSLEVVSADAANWLRQNPKYLQDIVVASRSAEGATRALAAATAAYNKEVSQRAALDAAVGTNASAIARAAGIIAIPGRGGTEKLQPKKAAVGLIPQAQEMAGAYAGGYKPGQVRDMNVPGMGRVYYNTAEKVKWFPGMGQPAIMPPQGSRAGRDYERDFAERHGFNPYAAGGMIPNFAANPDLQRAFIERFYRAKRTLTPHDQKFEKDGLRKRGLDIGELGVGGDLPFKGISYLPETPTTVSGSISAIVNRAPDDVTRRQLLRLAREFDYPIKAYGTKNTPSSNIFRDYFHVSGQANDEMTFAKTAKHLKYGIRDRQTYEHIDLNQLKFARSENVKRYLSYRSQKTSPYLFRGVSLDEITNLRRLGQVTSLGTSNADELLGTFITSSFGKAAGFGAASLKESGQGYVLALDKKRVMGRPTAESMFGSEEKNTIKAGRIEKDDVLGVIDLKTRQLRSLEEFAAKNEETKVKKLKLSEIRKLIDRRNYEPRLINESFIRDSIVRDRRGAIEDLNRAILERQLNGKSFYDLLDEKEAHEYDIENAPSIAYNKAKKQRRRNRENLSSSIINIQDKPLNLSRLRDILQRSDSDILSTGRYSMSRGLVPNFAQSITSADTSIKQIPGLFKKFGKQLGPLNIDIGGGKFDLGTDYLNSLGIKSRVYDPFNRSKEFNDETLANFFGKADSATIANVLNVIKEPDARKDLLEFIRKSVKQGGSSYFGIYEGNKSGIGAITSKGFQNNLPAGAYIDEISEFFNIKKKVSNYIVGSPKFNGFVPNFSPLSAAISRESAAVNPGLIRVGSHSALRGPGNPDGVGVYNLRDEPLGLGQGVERARAMGLNPKTHGIPNYASKWEQRKEKVIKDYLGDASSPEPGHNFMGAMALSMVAPAATTVFGEGKITKSTEELFNALSLGYTLSTFLRGPKGKVAAVGLAGISGFYNIIKQATNNFTSLKTDTDLLKDNLQKASNGLNVYATTLESLQNAYLNNNVSAEKIGILQNKLADSLAKLPAELRQQLIGAKSGGQVQEIIGKYSESQEAKLQEKEFALGLNTLLNEQFALPGMKRSLIGSLESGTKTGEDKLNAFADILLNSISEGGLKKIGGSAGLGRGGLTSVLRTGGISESTLAELERVNDTQLKKLQARMVERQSGRESDIEKFKALAPQRQREVEQAQMLEKRMKGARDTIKQTFEQIGQLANLRISIAGRRGLMSATGIGEQIQGVAGLIGETGSPAQAAMANYKAQIAANQIQAASGISNVFGGLRGGISTLFSNTDLSRMGDIPARMRAGQGSLMNILEGSSVSGIGEGAISLFKSLGKDDDTAEIKKLMADSNEKLVEIYQTLEEQNKLAEIQKNIALQRAEFERTLKVGGGLGSFMDRGVKMQQLSDIYSGKFGVQTGIFKGQGSIDLLKSFLGAGGQAGAPGFSKLLGVATEARAQDIISSQKDLNRAFQGTGLSLGVPSLADARKVAETQIASELKTGDSAMEKQMAQLQAALANTLSSSMGGQFNNVAQIFANVLAGSSTFIELNSTIDSTQQVLKGLDSTLKSLQGGGGYGVRAGGNIPISAAATEKMMAKAGGYNPGYIRRAGNLIYNSAERVDYLPGVREPIISPPPGSLAGFLHKQNLNAAFGFAADGNPYLFIPTSSLDKDQINAVKRAGYNPLDINAREMYRKGKLSIPKGSKLIDPTMSFSGGAVGYEKSLSKKSTSNLDILTGRDPGLANKLIETEVLKGLPKSQDLTSFLEERGISTKGKIDISAHQGLIEKEFGKGFFIKAKEGVQSRGVYSQHKLFGGYDPKLKTGLRSLEQNRPKIGSKGYFIQSGIPNISDRVFRVSTLGTESGSKILGKSQVRMIKGSIVADSFGDLVDKKGKLIEGGDALDYRSPSGEYRYLSKKERRENLISRRIAEAQAKRVMNSLPSKLRAGALAGMDVAETGYTGAMKRLQLLAEESGIGYSLFKGGGVIEPNFSDKLGYSGALQKTDLSVEVAKNLERIEKSGLLTSGQEASQNISSPVKAVRKKDARGRFIGNPKPIMGSQLKVGINTNPINASIKSGQIGYQSPQVTGINFEGGEVSSGVYTPGISDPEYKVYQTVKPKSNFIRDFNKLNRVAGAHLGNKANRLLNNPLAPKVGAGLNILGAGLSGYQLVQGQRTKQEAAEMGDSLGVAKGVYEQGMGVGGLVATFGSAPARLVAGRVLGLASAGLDIAQMSYYGGSALKAQSGERQAYQNAGFSPEQVRKMKESGQLDWGIGGDPRLTEAERKSSLPGVARAWRRAKYVLGTGGRVGEEFAPQMHKEHTAQKAAFLASLDSIPKDKPFVPSIIYGNHDAYNRFQSATYAQMTANDAKYKTPLELIGSRQAALKAFGANRAERGTYEKDITNRSVQYNADMLAKMFGISNPEQMKRLQLGVRNSMSADADAKVLGQGGGNFAAYVKSLGKPVAQPAATQQAQKSQEQAAGNKSEISVNVNMGGNLGVKNAGVEFSEEQYIIINSIVAEVAKGIEEKIKAIVERQPAEVRASVAAATPSTAIPDAGGPAFFM